MVSPLSTENPTPGELISNRLASSLSDIRNSLTAQKHKRLLAFTFRCCLPLWISFDARFHGPWCDAGHRVRQGGLVLAWDLFQIYAFLCQLNFLPASPFSHLLFIALTFVSHRPASIGTCALWCVTEDSWWRCLLNCTIKYITRGSVVSRFFKQR